MEQARLTKNIFTGKIEQDWIAILPISSESTLFGFLYFICTDELSFADFNLERPQIETLVRLVASTIEQRMQSTQIQLLNQELASRVKSAIEMSEQKNSQLIEAEKQAQLASKAKSEFLANMSHEIRTPLNGVMGTISLLKNTPLTNEQIVFLEALETSSESLYRIVNDILDLTKIEAGR
jgi:signal transduction histidine kinase